MKTHTVDNKEIKCGGTFCFICLQIEISERKDDPNEHIAPKPLTDIFRKEIKPGEWDFVKYIEPEEEKRCLIRQYFKAYPNEKAVSMSCNCKLCSVRC